MHFSYSAPAPGADLRQGDILIRSEQMEGVLRAVHPHYFEKPTNRYFIVLTQDCDLVRRDGKVCDSRYITIAPARPLSALLSRQLAVLAERGISTDLPVCTIRSKNKLQMFLE